MFSLSWGRYPVPLDAVWQTLTGQNTDETYQNIIFNLRLPRIAAAMLVGMALSLAGAVYQGIFRNPLVSPDLLGVSSGACVGAAAAGASSPYQWARASSQPRFSRSRNQPAPQW